MNNHNTSHHPNAQDHFDDDEATRLLGEQATQSNNNDMTESEQNRMYARQAMER